MGHRLYDEDFYAWTQQQANALRTLATHHEELDVDLLAEEIESLGASDRSSCERYLDLIMTHLLKIEFVGPVDCLRGWRKEVRAFRKGLRGRLSPSLRAQLSTDASLDELYARAVGDLRRDLEDDGVDAALPDLRPYAWDQVSGRSPDWFPEPRYTAQ